MAGTSLPPSVGDGMIGMLFRETAALTIRTVLVVGEHTEELVAAIERYVDDRAGGGADRTQGVSRPPVHSRTDCLSIHSSLNGLPRTKTTTSSSARQPTSRGVAWGRNDDVRSRLSVLTSLRQTEMWSLVLSTLHSAVTSSATKVVQSFYVTRTSRRTRVRVKSDERSPETSVMSKGSIRRSTRN